MEKNTIISIGWLGFMTCYLNVSREDAIRRWMADNNENEPTENMINICQVTDQWGSYDGAWDNS